MNKQAIQIINSKLHYHDNQYFTQLRNLVRKLVYYYLKINNKIINFYFLSYSSFFGKYFEVLANEKCFIGKSYLARYASTLKVSLLRYP